MSNATTSPALLSDNVFTLPAGAARFRLLIVIVPGDVPEVTESTDTVLVLVLMIWTALCLLVGLPADQLPAVSHLPLPLFFQLFV
jgi:hypothetical protein